MARKTSLWSRCPGLNSTKIQRCYTGFIECFLYVLYERQYHHMPIKYKDLLQLYLCEKAVRF